MHNPDSNLGCKSPNHRYLMGHQPASSRPIFPQYVLKFTFIDDLACPAAWSPGDGGCQALRPGANKVSVAGK